MTTTCRGGRSLGCAESGETGPILAQELIRFLCLFLFVSWCPGGHFFSSDSSYSRDSWLPFFSNRRFRIVAPFQGFLWGIDHLPGAALRSAPGYIMAGLSGRQNEQVFGVQFSVFSQTHRCEGMSPGPGSGTIFRPPAYAFRSIPPPKNVPDPLVDDTKATSNRQAR